MTLDKHTLDGIERIKAKTLPADEFDALLLSAGYRQIGSAPAKGRRLKVWWTHDRYRRIEAIYSPDGRVAITAYHLDE